MCYYNASSTQRNRLPHWKRSTPILKFESKAMNLFMPFRKYGMTPDSCFHGSLSMDS
ncbi:hypothetical protein AWB67_06453 [Caballeronia terrestris]|uniref:Uncharacterized protein n=1 Tax=Caballeronia terrestris TaxID=1226301 RepID=A0A158KR38_9BURK|nr:hypothetical protein AWB67_06453 [Caballeronia terrestris]